MYWFVLTLLALISPSNSVGRERAPAALWSVSLRAFGYQAPSNPDSLYVDRDVAVAVTERYVIAIFRLATELQRERPRSASASATARLVAFDLATGRPAWHRDVQIRWSLHGSVLWAVKGVGYSIRAPDSVDLYSETGEQLRSFPLPDSDVSPSASGRLIGVAAPPRRSALDTEQPRDLFAIDLVNGKRVVAVHTIFDSFFAGERELVFSIPPQIDRGVRGRSVSRTWALYTAREDSPAKRERLMTMPFYAGWSLSPSRFVLVTGASVEDVVTQQLSVCNHRGNVLFEQSVDGRITATTAAGGRIAFAHVYGDDQDIEFIDASGPAATGAKKLLFGQRVTGKNLFRLHLKSVSGEHAQIALSSDASKLAVINDGTVSVYVLSALR